MCSRTHFGPTVHVCPPPLGHLHLVHACLCAHPCSAAPVFLRRGITELSPLLTCSSGFSLFLLTYARAHPNCPGLSGPGWVSPTVLKLLKMATGMRALLDTVVQALPQVRSPPSGGPPGCHWCLTGPDVPSPACPELGLNPVSRDTV